jgi:tetratricopeptide (TPR) repeat protein
MHFASAVPPVPMMPIMTEIAAAPLAAAARALMLAGRWAQAASLLESAAPADEAERAVLAVAAAEVAVDQDFWLRTDCGPTALTRAASMLTGDFDLEFLRLKHEYASELFGSAGDPSVASRLADRAAALRDSAPDPVRRANAAFYQGVIADNLRGDTSGARASFEEALRLGEEAGDELVTSYALRHLGYLVWQAGDVAAGREMLRRSLELRARVGCVPHVLAQQLALAELARDTGDAAWARTVAGEVRSWASAFDGTWLIPAADGLLG